MSRNNVVLPSDARRSSGPSVNFADLPPLLVAACALAITLLGIGFFISPLLTAGALIGLVGGGLLLRLGWERPEVALVGLVFVTSSFVAANSVSISISFASLDLRDFALVGGLSLLLLRELREKKKNFELPWWPVTAAYLLFMSVALFSLLYALLVMKVRPNLALNEFRALFYCVVFVMVAWAIRRPDQLRFFLIGAFILADITALIVILQQFLGTEQYLLAAMAQDWRVEGETNASGFGTTRIIPPGHVLVFVMMVTAFGLFMLDRQKGKTRAWHLFQFLFLNFGLLLTYTRSQWIAAFLAIGLISIFLPIVERRRLLSYGFVFAIIGAFALAVLSPQMRQSIFGSSFVTALSERFGSILTPEETLQSYSLEWRAYENGEALRVIREHPVMGVGLGNAYRDYTLLQKETLGMKEMFLRFIHNSYLYITVKMGLLGLAAFIIFALTFLYNGFRAFQTIRDPFYKRLALVYLTSFVGILSWCITEPHLMMVEGAAVVGLVIGLVACVRQLDMASEAKA